VLRALAEAGRRVPEDVSVVGFDDVADAADYRPPLTTVRQDFDALGERAVASLIAGIEDDRPRRFETVVTRLVVRASTAPRAVAASRTRSAPSPVASGTVARTTSGILGELGQDAAPRPNPPESPTL